MRLLTRRPRLVVGIWIVLTVALAVYGKDISERLNSQIPYIDGTAAKRAHDIAVQEFGGEDTLIVMLRGPRAALERQGQALASRFGAMPRTEVVSPWTPGLKIDDLRPTPRVGAFVMRFERREGEELHDLLPPVQRRIDETVRAPVRASIAGFPAIHDAFRSANEEATALGEMIAVPALLLVLLFVFRSVLAALIPLVVGGAVVAATRGVMSLFAGIVDIDLFALGLIGMMGLALGVDYTLLAISRFREEVKSRDLAEAVQVTTRATAHSVLPAGSGLLLAMIVTLFVLPGSSGVSIATAVMLATALSMVSALCVVPALLMLLGPNLDRWTFAERRGSQVASLRWSRRLAGRPRVVVSVMVSLLLLSVWAFTLRSGVITVDLLQADDPGRIQQEDVQRGLGPGWVTPMEIVVNAHGSPVTAPRRLRALARFQHGLERDPGVETVAGFAEIERGATQLSGVERGLLAQEQGLDRLETGLSRASDGAGLNTDGLLAAAEGSRQLNAGIGAANGGADLLTNGLEAASAGSGQLSEGLGAVAAGSGELSEGASEASTGAGRLADAIERLREKSGEIGASAELFRNAMLSGEDRLADLHAPLRTTEEQLAVAWRALQRMTTGRSDPEYVAALEAIEEASRQLGGEDPRTGEQADPSYDGVGAGVERAEGQFGVGLYLTGRLEKTGEQAEKGVTKLARGSAKLDRGLRRLMAGSQQLSGAMEELSGGGERLSPALTRLSDGAARLEAGLTQLGTGANRLAGGLGGGAQKSKLLAGALNRIGEGLSRGRGADGGGSGLDQLQTRSPNLFRSGYFVLAGLDGSPPRQREQLASLINLDRGGGVARMLVIPRDESSTAAARETTERLEEDAAELARETGAEVVVGGVVPNEIEINDAFRENAPVLRLALALVTFLVLFPVVRSLVLPLIAALLNLVMVSASFGILSLLFNTSLLGGPGFVETTVIPATVIIIFALAIDYEVFIFARIREEYVRTGSPSAAIRNGLDRTGPVVTGAAMIMIVVFLSFSVSSFIPTRNFGIAQTIAVFLDAFVIRLVVIPAVMERLGEWSWWLPDWLDRLLPGTTVQR